MDDKKKKKKKTVLLLLLLFDECDSAIAYTTMRPH